MPQHRNKVPPRSRCCTSHHYQNVEEAGEVEKADLVKSFEYAKNKYIEIDPEELKALRLINRRTCQVGSVRIPNNYEAAVKNL
jgi:non-homologous end joining protein Ku